MDVEDTANWIYPSSEAPGFHAVVTPDNSACTCTWVYRLNLVAGESHTIESGDKEMNGVVIAGTATVVHGSEEERLDRLDSFYLPGDDTVVITATDDLIMYIGAARWDDEGAWFVRRFDLAMPIGEIHQIHGEPPYQREVFMTINQEVPGSRLICGLTWGEDGGWTSWPPHQHSQDLEEVYCYFDIPRPQFALHLGYREPGKLETVHPVSSGDFAAVPVGYHPTVGMPGVRSTYFWVMAAHSRASRRYDLAVNDPAYDGH